MAPLGGHVISPNNVAADTYYSIDRLVQNNDLEAFMGFSLPRTSAHAVKPYALTDPLLLYVIRDTPGSCDEVDAMMVKFTTADTYAYSKLLYITYEKGDDSMHYWLAVSNEESTLGSYGSSSNSIMQYKLEGDFQCQASGPFTGTVKKVTNNPDPSQAGQNLYTCYPDSSTDPLCEVVDLKANKVDEAKIVYVVNTNYKRSLLNAIENDNVAIDAQGNQMTGTYVVINGGETDLYQSEQTTPQIDQFFIATVTAYTPPFTNPVVNQAVSDCLLATFTQTTSPTYAAGAEYVGQAAQVSGSPTNLNSITMDPPTTYTCTGTSTECDQCIFHGYYLLSETQNALTGTNGVFVETDLAQSKLRLYYEAHARYANNSYIQSNAYDTTGATLYHQFTILFNVGRELVYPDCSPWCLYDPNNGSPLVLINQKAYREYYSTTAGTCWEALSECQGCLDQNPLTNNVASDGTSQACTPTGCLVGSLDYTPPSPLLSFFTSIEVPTYSVPLSTLTATLNSADVIAEGVWQLVSGSYVAPAWNIFTIGSTSLDINSGSGNVMTNQQLYVKFNHYCQDLQSELTLWDPQSHFGSHFVEYVPFTLTILVMDCLPLDLVPQSTVTLTEGTFLEADATTNYHRIAIEGGAGSVTFALNSVFVFSSNINECYAASIILCQDILCATQLSSGPITFVTNPSVADGSGNNSPQLVVTKTPLNTLVYVNIVSNVGGQNQISPVRIAVCGLEAISPNSIPIVVVPLGSVDTWVTITATSSLFSYTHPYSDIPDSICEIQSTIYCLDAACVSLIPASNIQISLGNLQLKRAYLTQSLQVYIQATTKGLVQATNSAIICFGNSTVTPQPSYTIQQEYPGSPTSWLFSEVLYSSDPLCPTLTYSLTLTNGSALSIDEQAVASLTATSLAVTPPAHQQNITLNVTLSSLLATGETSSVNFSLNFFASPPELPRAILNGIPESTTNRIYHEIVRGEESEKLIFSSQILNMQNDTSLEFNLDPLSISPLLVAQIVGSQFWIQLDEREVTEELAGTYQLTASISSHDFQTVATYTFAITIRLTGRGDIEVKLNYEPVFVTLPPFYNFTVPLAPEAGEEVVKESKVLQLPPVIDYPLDTISVSASKLQPFMVFDEATLQMKLENIDYTNEGNYTFVVLLEDQHGAYSEYLISLKITATERIKVKEEQTTPEHSEEEVHQDEQTPEIQHYPERIQQVAKTTFRGIDLASLLAAQKNEGKNKETAPPVATFRIDISGVCTMRFNQRMISPNSVIQSDYDEVFDFWIFSVLDGSDMVGTQFTTKASRKLSNQSSEFGNFEWAERLRFNAEVINHTSREINFQLKFENPKFVSSTNYGYDQLLIQILKPEMFISAETFRPMTSEVFEEQKPEVMLNVPPILDDTNLAKDIANTIDKGGDFLNAFTTGNFFINLILKGSMQQLWGMIRSLQLIFLSSLININHAPHTVLFLKLCMVFAQMDILNGEEFYEEYMTFKHTEPLTGVFNQYGIENMNFFLNSGSFLVLQVLIILYFTGQWFLNRLATRYYQDPNFRKLGIWAYQDKYGLELVKASQKLFMESYLDLVLITVLNTCALFESKDHADFMEYFTGSANILNNTIGSVCMVQVVCFPIYSFTMIKNNFETLQMKQTRDKYEVFYEGIRTNSMMRAQYNTIFLVRRALTVVILVFLDHPFFQVALLMVFSVVNFIYQFTERPQTDKLSYLVECANEFTVLMFSYLVSVVLNSAMPIHFKYQIGWALIIIATCNVVFNVVLLIVEQTFKSFTSIKQARQIRAYKAKVQKKIDSRKLICETGEHDHFKEQISIYDAISYCRSWFPERQWLLKNNIDITDLKEEQDFMAMAREHNLFQKARQIQVRQSVIQAQRVRVQRTHQSEIVKKIRQSFLQSNPTEESQKQKRAQPRKKGKSENNILLNPRLITIQEVETESDHTPAETNSNYISIKPKINLLQTSVFMKGLNIDKPALGDDLEEPDEVKSETLESILRKESGSLGVASTFIEEEKSNYGITLEEKRSSRNGLLRQHNPFSLDFMVEEQGHEVEEYSNQILHMASLSDQQMLLKFFQNKGLCQINCKRNHCQQAVLQTLLEVQDLKAFFIYRHFEAKDELNSSVMKEMANLFTTAYSPVIKAFDDLKEIDIDDYLSRDNDPATNLTLIIQSLVQLMTTRRAVFDDLKQKQCIKDSEATGDVSLLRSHFDAVFPSLAAQQFTCLHVHVRVCKDGHESYDYEASRMITLRRQGSFEETVKQCFNQEVKLHSYCPQCLRTVNLTQKRKLAIFPSILILNINSADLDANEEAKDWQIPAYYNFKQYFFRPTENWKEFMTNNVNYQVFAIITKEQGEYVATVRKYDHDEGLFQWYKFYANHNHKLTEDQALRGNRAVVVMYRVKPNLKQVPAPPLAELQLEQPNQAKVCKSKNPKEQEKKGSPKAESKKEEGTNLEMFDKQTRVLIRLAQKNKTRIPAER